MKQYRIIINKQGWEGMYIQGRGLEKALKIAESFSIFYGSTKLFEKSSGRWFTLAEAKDGEIICKAKKFKRFMKKGMI